MKKFTLYFLITLATFSLSSFGIIDNPRAAVEIQSNKKNTVITPKSISGSGVFFLREVKPLDESRTDGESKSFMQRFILLVYSSIAKIIIGIIS